MPCKILADSHGWRKVAKSDAEDRIGWNYIFHIESEVK